MPARVVPRENVMKWLRRLIAIACLSVLLLPPVGRFAAAAAAATTTADLDSTATAELKTLIDQLGDSDFAKREDAARQIKALGRPTVPALKEAARTSEDPEIVSRAQALIKRIEIRPVPGPDPARGRAMASRINMRFNNGARTIDATENGRTVKIVDGNDGITMTVTGVLNGQPATEEFTAKDYAQLKEDNPAAAELYEEYNARMGQGGILRGPIRVNGGIVVFNGPALGGIPMPLAPPPDELEQLRGHLGKQMTANKLKDDQRADVLKGVDALVEARNASRLGGMEKYSDQCDAFRKTLEQYKLDAGEFLPPPAKSRLGVTVVAVDGQLLVREVGDNSRAQRIGLQADDLILKVDGKEVTGVGDLRKAAMAKEKGLVVEVSRDGMEVKLEEKDGKKE